MPPSALTKSLAIRNKAKHYQAKSKATGTQAVYRSALRDFDEFCRGHHWQSAPAAVNTITEYLSFIADGQSVSTIRVKLAAIAHAHRIAHLPDPTVDAEVKTTLEGISREKGTRPTPKAPATLEVIEAMIEQLPDTLTGMRDRAILLLGFGGMFRRSELVALTMKDVTLAGNHLTILIRHGKTDQAGHGLEKHFQILENQVLCPVRALQAWLRQAGIRSGPVFRSVDRWGKISDTHLSTESIAQIVKHAALGAGLDPDVFAGHSLRRGGITSALAHQAEERNVMLQTGHTDPKTLRHYNDDSGRGATLAARAAFGETE